jgi:hypothetical protein
MYKGRSIAHSMWVHLISLYYSGYGRGKGAIYTYKRMTRLVTLYCKSLMGRHTALLSILIPTLFLIS